MLSHAVMTQLGRDFTRMHSDRVERIVYHAKANAVAPVLVIPRLLVLFQDFDEALMALYQPLTEKPLVERGDQQLRIQTELVTWLPTTYDKVYRDDGTAWRVMGTRGGRTRPWWFLHLHDVTA